MPQSTSGHGHGHGHNNTAPHVGPHAHSLAVQSQGPAVIQGHVHPPTPLTSTQGQQQFQRLKVPLHGQIYKLYNIPTKETKKKQPSEPSVLT